MRGQGVQVAVKHLVGLAGAALALAVAAPPAAAQYATRPAIVYGTGGKADKSFNEAANLGVRRYARAMGVDVAEFEPADDALFEMAQRQYAAGGYDPIVVIGFPQAAALARVAKEFPRSRFTIIDAKVDLPNVRSVLFREQESSYLVGMAAALASKSGKVGFVGGMDSPLMRRFLCGYEQGARAARAGVEVIGDMAGTTPAAWNDPAAGTRLAQAQFARGVDVIYAAAGTTGLAVLQAAQARGKLAIGSANKGFSDPGTLLTSTAKRVDAAVFQALISVAQGRWRSGEFTVGLAEGALDWAPEDYNKKLITKDMWDRIDAARAAIVSGRIRVHDFAATNSCPR